MRRRTCVRATLLCTLTAVAAVPATAGAAPTHDDGLTIAATPNHIVAGTGILIYGQLKGSDVADQTIYLYHRIRSGGHVHDHFQDHDRRHRLLRGVRPTRRPRWSHPRLRNAGDDPLRAYLPTDARNTAGSSDSSTVKVQQTQNPGFTIVSSAPAITVGASTTISVTPYDSGSTTTPAASVPVELYARTVNGAFEAVASATTLTDGSYSFGESPVNNTVYRVETTARPVERMAGPYEAVADPVSAEHVHGARADLRGPENVGVGSTPVTVTVAGDAPASSLTAAT